MTHKRPFQTLTSHIDWSCPWYAVRRDEILLPNGQRGEYNTITKGPAVWILPVTPDGQIVLVHHYRYTVDDWCYEIPAGGVKPDQTLEEAAREELREEVGGTAQSWAYLGQSYMANGICDEVGHFFLATGVQLGQPAHEPAEVLHICPTPWGQALHMARTNQIADAPSVLVILQSEARLRALFS